MTAVDRGLEGRIARLLTIGTVASVILLALGGVAMLAAGLSALDPAPAFDLAALPGDLAAVRPVGLLWLGLIVVLATPAARVAAGLVGYLRDGERGMALVALLVLVVIAAGVASGMIGA